MAGDLARRKTGLQVPQVEPGRPPSLSTVLSRFAVTCVQSPSFVQAKSRTNTVGRVRDEG